MKTEKEEAIEIAKSISNKELREEFLSSYDELEKEVSLQDRAKKMSLEELDGIVGGRDIGDFYECVDYKNRCTSLGIGVDFCENNFTCDGENEKPTKNDVLVAFIDKMFNRKQ